MSSALRVNTATRSASISSGEGQQNGVGVASPLRFLLLCSTVLYLFCGVVASRFMWGRFPSNVPHPPSGQVMQKHGHIRPRMVLDFAISYRIIITRQTKEKRRL